MPCSMLKPTRTLLKRLKKSNPSLFGVLQFVFVIAVPFFFLGVILLAVWLLDAYDSYKFNRVSSAEHLRLAQDICHSKQSSTVCLTSDLSSAARHLERIPSSAPEYGEAVRLLALVRQQEHSIEERQRQALEKAQALRATNDFTCSTGLPRSCGGRRDDGQCAIRPIISFDNGTSWVEDDGRCAAREQKRRDEDAQLDSYWPTTIRVDTDMDSFWLNNEERTCETYPNDKGKVAVVACNATGSHRDHNIPVTFWGGVDRNTVSDWKWRREGEDFACRALD